MITTVRARAHKRTKLAYGLSVLLLAAIVWWIFPMLRLAVTLPSDAAIVHRFLSHRDQLGQLVAMAQEDSNVVRIAPAFTWLGNDMSWPRSPDDLGFSAKRWNFYKTLFNEIGLPNGLIWRSDIRGIVFMSVASRGVFGNGEEKGFAYVAVPPESVSTLRSSVPDSGIGTFLYDSLAPNWYLYYRRR